MAQEHKVREHIHAEIRRNDHEIHIAVFRGVAPRPRSKEKNAVDMDFKRQCKRELA